MDVSPIICGDFRTDIFKKNSEQLTASDFTAASVLTQVSQDSYIICRISFSRKRHRLRLQILIKKFQPRMLFESVLAMDISKIRKTPINASAVSHLFKSCRKNAFVFHLNENNHYCGKLP